MVFPLLTAGVVFVTGLFIRNPWAEHKRRLLRELDQVAMVKEAAPAVNDIKEAMANQMTYEEALDKAERLMRSAQQELQRARAPSTSPN
jgi:hypothetical protein